MKLDIGPLSKAEATIALQCPENAVDITFTSDAIDEIFRLTEGYPYFLQEWGYLAWNRAEKSPIDLQLIQTTTPDVIKRLDENFFRVRFDRLTVSEKMYLRAMAELGPTAHRSSEIADILNAKLSSLGPVRARLIKKGMIYSPTHGDMAFTVPLFDAFMRRVMPEFPHDH